MGKLHRRTFARACLGMMVPLGNSCGKSGGGLADKTTPVKIVALVDSLLDPFRNSQSYLLRQLAQTRAATELRVLDAGGDAQFQSDQLPAALAAKPDFLIIFPVDSAALAPALVQAAGSGPRMFVFAEVPSPIPRASVIICPDVETGRIAGEFVVGSLRLKAAEEGRTEPAGRIVELTVAAPDAPHSGYSAGFLKSISQHPGIALVHQAPCKMLGDDTANRVGEALRLQKDFDVIFAHNDMIARAASKAVAVVRPELTGRILVLGADGCLGKGGGKEMIIKGEIDATIYRPPLVDLAWALIEKCLGDPQFTPKPRYEVKPVALNLEAALEAARTGIPGPPVE